MSGRGTSRKAVVVRPGERPVVVPSVREANRLLGRNDTYLNKLPGYAEGRVVLADGTTVTILERTYRTYDWTPYGEEILAAARRLAREIRYVSHDPQDRLDLAVELLWKRLNRSDPRRYASPVHCINVAVQYARRDAWRRRDRMAALRETDPEAEARAIREAPASPSLTDEEVVAEYIPDDPPILRRVALMKLKGLTVAETAKVLGTNARNVRRAIADLKDILRDTRQ